MAIGYTGGTQIGGEWTVGTNDSHAWPELYFEGVGWLPFEPTPAGSLGQGSARVPAYTQPRPSATTSSDGPATPGATDSCRGRAAGPGGPRQNPRELDREALIAAGGLPVDESMPLIAQDRHRRGRAPADPADPGRDQAGARGAGGSARSGWKVSRPADEVTARVVSVSHPSVAAAWAELDDALCDYGLTRQASETPRALARRLTEQYEFDAESAAAVMAIAHGGGAGAVRQGLPARSAR